MNPWQMILLQEAEIGLRAIFAVFAANISAPMSKPQSAW